MGQACDENKKAKIKETIRKTAEKRHQQICKVRTVKITYSKLSEVKKEALIRVFLEAKWFYNYVVDQYNNGTPLKNINTSVKSVMVKVQQNYIQKDLKVLSGQSKQSIVSSIASSLKTLKTLKDKGYKVGKLKFKSEVNAVELKQYGTSHKVIDSKRIRVVHFNTLYVRGLDQIPADAEYANAKLLKKHDGYYVALTIYTPLQKKQRSNNISEIGIDLGIKTGVTLSDGRKFDARIEESDRLKRLQRKFAKAVKGSNNAAKILRQIRCEYRKIECRKDDKANKIVHEILKYDKIYMQDENISAWHRTFGKSVQRSILGRVKSFLINLPETEVLKKYRPTTKWCPECQHLHRNLKLRDRVYTCPNCGYTEDRDIHAAKNMITMVHQLQQGIYKQI